MNNSFTKKKQGSFRLSDELGFGKYHDWTLKEVIQQDMNYIEWCLQEEIFTFADGLAWTYYLQRGGRIKP